MGLLYHVLTMADLTDTQVGAVYQLVVTHCSDLALLKWLLACLYDMYILSCVLIFILF